MKKGGFVKYEGIYCMYLRKSREDLELEKYEGIDTLSRHEKILTDFAKQNGISIGHIYREVVSGDSISEREEVQKMLKAIENRVFAGTLVVEVERLARGDTIDQGIVANAFKYSHSKIVTPIKTYDPDNEFDEEYFEFGLFMARREYKTINRRLQRGRKTSINEGKYVGSIPPFGYKRKKLDNAKGYTLVPNIKESEIVKKIFELYSYEDISINSVVNKMNELGLKPRKAECWSISSIKDILNNPVYIGKIRWDSRKQVVSSKDGKRIVKRPRNKDVTIIDGLHKPIIDEKVWNIVQNKRSCNAPPVQHNNVIQNPLMGIVICEKCGKPMQRRPYNLAGKPSTLICSNSNCDNISSKLYLVEEKIIKAIEIWLKSYKLDYSQLNRKNKTTVYSEIQVLKEIENKLIKEKEKLNNVYGLLEDGTYTRKEFTERSTVLKNNIDEYEKEFNKIKDILNKMEEVEKKKDIIIPKLKNVIDVYNELESSEEKNILLKSILEKVTYLKTEKAIKKGSDPTNFTIRIYPKIPKIN